ncbi:DEAD/DEAH box helicase [Actinocatenispora rupis]|uniref:Helicase HelZ n=1 Tax=Actinocatenispora rupis TaxID=519421 RepID=A0A8J3J4N9_9ACTN|nr:DEAD/DEAH box helicase [Actinocatenispora rupis]GID10077.1 helicase HelZ [Actinocatenispora rupis]
MLALHGLWTSDHRLALWAEDARLLGEPARLTDPGGPAPHPYACPAPVLAELLSAVGPSLEWLAARARHGRVVLRMPVQGGAPVPSPDLSTLGMRAPGAGPPQRDLVRFTVPALLFDPAEAAQLLGELSEPASAVLPTESPAGTPVELPCGTSLLWLILVHDLAWRLVGRGRVLPTVRTGGGAPEARWVPVSDATAWAEIRRLTACCPPVCRAEWTPHEPAGRAAADLVADLLDCLVDREVRAAARDRAPLLGSAPDTAAAAWLRALTAPDGRIGDADPDGIVALADALDGWRRSGEPRTGPLRLCFRLVEPIGPEDDDDPSGSSVEDRWRLEFLVQPVDEPSLLVRAADVWSDGPSREALRRSAHRPADVLLAELDRAAQYFPRLRDVVRTYMPGEVVLDRAGAHEFLRDVAPQLSTAGYGVLLPAWWRRPHRFGLALHTSTVSGRDARRHRLVDRDALVAFQWRAAIDGVPLSGDELRMLASAKEPLVRVHGRWLAADPEQIAAAAAFLARADGGTMSSAEVLRLAVDPDAEVAGLPVTGIATDGTLATVLSTPDSDRETVAPQGFRAELRPYQRRGLAWLGSMSRLGVGAVLADDMGLGKTVQVLALLAAEKAERDEPADAEPTLLICPMSVVGNWQREAARFAPDLTVHVHHGAQRLGGRALADAVRGCDLVVTTYGVAHRDVAQLREIGWRRVVVDEAQYIKNSGTRQSAAIRSLPARHRVALTGTPVENRLTELHAILDFANPGLFGSRAAFRERYAIPIEQGNERATAAFRARIRPFVLRRLKTDPAVAAELPDKVELTVLCNLTAEQATLYQAVVNDMLARMKGAKGIRRRGVVLSTLTRLKQICNHPAHFLQDGSAFPGRSGKLARLEDILETVVANGERALVFTQYAQFGAMLQRHLRHRLPQDVLYLHGGVPQRRRDHLVERFQQPDGPAVLVLSVKAGGTGLNLTAANHVIHVDRWWNPAVEEQASDRAFRIGQRRDVQIRKLVCVGTVEERIDALIEGKRALARTSVGSDDGWLTELSTDALHELVTLSAEAIGG